MKKYNKVLPLLITSLLTSCDLDINIFNTEEIESETISESYFGSETISDSSISSDKNSEYISIPYYLISGTTSLIDLEDYFGIADTNIKYFTCKEDLDAFNNIVREELNTNDYDNLLNKNIDFDKYKVATLAVYVDGSPTTFAVNSIESSGTSILVNMTYTIESFTSQSNSFSFLYMLLDKDDNSEINSLILGNQRHDQYVCYKPIMYFYPTKEMDLSIIYEDMDRLITTYPKYTDSWNIHLNENGTFTTSDSEREYYALYYDEISNYSPSFIEGFNVNKDNAISFLEEKLDYIGLTNREANEFMMYWLPILESYENSIVYFELTDIRNNECPLTFSINPDSLLRVIIHIKEVDEPINIKEQELTHFERNGFTIVEWGGTIH